MRIRDRFRKPFIMTVAAVAFAALAFAQFPIKIPKLPIPANLFEKESPLTTSLTDAVTEIPFLDDFQPSAFTPLSQLPYGPNNGFMIPGAGGDYMLLAQSYCYHAGTHSPSHGKGYLYAPLKGGDAEVIRNILERSVNHPKIPQQDVQALVWAVLARTKPSQMNPPMKANARNLLQADEIDRLEGSAFQEVSQDVLGKALGKLPPQTRQVFEAERMIRDGVRRNLRYDELERMAVLAGEPLPGKDDRAIPSGRWSYHPEGYFVRYFPHGYPLTRLEAYFTENIKVKRDLLNRIIGIVWTNGRELSVEYDDSVRPLDVAKDNAYKGYPMKSVRLELEVPPGENADKAEAMDPLAVELTDGWTYAGDLDGRGKASADNRYPNAEARYNAARTQADDLRKLLTSIEKFDKNKKMRTFAPSESARLLDLMQFTLALKELCAAKGAVRSNLLFDPVELAQRAWAAELEVLVWTHQTAASGALVRPRLSDKQFAAFPFATRLDVSHAPPSRNPDPKPFEFDSSSGAASPAETGRQRLGVSSRPAGNNGACSSSYLSCLSNADSGVGPCISLCWKNLSPSNEGRMKTMGGARDRCIATCYAGKQADYNVCRYNAIQCMDK